MNETPEDPDDETPDQPVRIPIEDALDLHPFQPRDVPSVVGDYIEAAAEKGLVEVRIIHGRGIGLQRDRVRAVLAEHPLVESYEDAPVSRGHWGATIVRIRTG
jgi:DNA-nicking Smr family endonuclease